MSNQDFESTHQLLNYTLHLADDVLILGHRNSEWTGHGPVLEQDIALSNIALDLVGQARNFYQYAAELKNDGSTEDNFAYLRDAHEFKNCLLVEQPNGDWGKTILRQCFFSVYQFNLYQQLKTSQNRIIASIAEKALKEIIYHIRWSSEWVIRLGDGTEESHIRINQALQELWEFTNELFLPAQYEMEVAKNGILIDFVSIKSGWTAKVDSILKEATLSFPPDQIRNREQFPSGKEGQHSENLDHILSEMQSLQKSKPRLRVVTS